MDSEPTSERSKKVSRRKFLKGMAAVTIPGLAAEAVALGIAEKRRSSQEKEITGNYLNPEQAKNLLGYNPEEHGFKAYSQVASRNGKHIVHIGQTHASSYIENKDKEKAVRNTVDSQEQIRSVISAAKPTIVYLEGVTETNLNDYREIKEIQQSQFKSIEPGPKQWQTLLQRYQEVIYQEFNQKKRGAFAECYEYIFHLEVERLQTEYKKQGTQEERLASFENNMQDALLIDQNSTFFVPFEYSLGSVLQMYYEGSIEKLGQAEIEKQNREAQQAHERYLAKTISQDEYEKAVDQTREATAINLIRQGETNRKSNDQLIYLVYGNSHDFSQETASGQDYGLIKLEPIIP